MKNKLALTLVPWAFGALLTLGFAVAPHSHADVCQEDQACWDCTTMGNHICGV